MPVLKGRFSVYVYQSESDIFLNTSNPKFSVENRLDKSDCVHVQLSLNLTKSTKLLVQDVSKTYLNKELFDNTLTAS